MFELKATFFQKKKGGFQQKRQNHLKGGGDICKVSAQFSILPRKKLRICYGKLDNYIYHINHFLHFLTFLFLHRIWRKSKGKMRNWSGFFCIYQTSSRQKWSEIEFGFKIYGPNRNRFFLLCYSFSLQF